MNTKKLNQIFKRLAAANPIPESELEYINPYTFLVAVVLSAQATDVGVNKATSKLFQVVRTPEEMVALGEQELKSYIKTINLFPTKAKNIIGLSKALIENFNSQVPSSLKDLTSLPGVGLKSAHVVLNCVFNHPVIAVDTHVFRVARRIGLTHSTTAHKVSDDLAKIIPDQWKMHAGHWLVLHGRYTCKARKPLCEKCEISEFCDYYMLKGFQDSGRRAKVEHRSVSYHTRGAQIPEACPEPSRRARRPRILKGEEHKSIPSCSS